MRPTRRGFVMGCSAAVAAMAGARLGFASLGDPDDGHDLLVVLFLRGGMDGLSLVAPLDGPDRGHYEAARPRLALPASGGDALLDLGGGFGLHPSAAPLHELYQDGRLAVVHACGMHVDTRSHFDAMEYMELGTPGSRAISTGWLARHLATAPATTAGALMPSLAVGTAQPTSLLGDRRTVAMEDPDDFSIDAGPWLWRDAQRLALRRMWNLGSSSVHRAGLQAMDAMDLVEAYSGEAFEPAGGAVYPEDGFGRQMRLVAQMVKTGIGLRVAALDLGGWDTHERQSWWFADLIGSVAAGLAALSTDLDASGGMADRLTVVVMTEFGRRFRENADEGTDHGHGFPMLVLGGAVRGGLHGEWPGLAPDQLYDGADLAVTTDYRRVLSEILVRRLGNPNLGQVFPGYADYGPLGIVDGPDLVIG